MSTDLGHKEVNPWGKIKSAYFYLKEAYLLYSNKMYQIMYYVIVSKY